MPTNALRESLRADFRTAWLAALDDLLRRARDYGRAPAPPAAAHLLAIDALAQAALWLWAVEWEWRPLGLSPRDLAPLPPGPTQRLHVEAIRCSEGGASEALLLDLLAAAAWYAAESCGVANNEG